MIFRLAARRPLVWRIAAGVCLWALVLGIGFALRPAPEKSTTALSAQPRKERRAVPAPQPAAPPTQPGPPRSGLVIVMDDLGEDMQAVHSLLELKLPIAFAVWPHARHATEAAKAARAAGHTVLIHQPMQALNPKALPGPETLTTGMTREAMEGVLRRGMHRLPQAEGLNNHMGSRFTSSREDVRRLCGILAGSGLFVLDSVTHPASVLYEEARKAGMAAARRTIFLDAEPGGAFALTQLRAAEKSALQGKKVVAIGHPRKETLAALREWNARRNAGLHLLSLRDCLIPPEGTPQQTGN